MQIFKTLSGLSITLSLVIPGCVEIRERTLFYPDGSTKERYSYYNDENDNEVRSGLTIKWYENGELEERSNWEEGLLHGSYERWYQNGVKKELSNWIFSKKNGLETHWFDDEQLKSLVKWEDGKKDSLETIWYYDGVKKSEIEYSLGERLGYGRAWDEDGYELESPDTDDEANEDSVETAEPAEPEIPPDSVGAKEKVTKKTSTFSVAEAALDTNITPEPVNKDTLADKKPALQAKDTPARQTGDTLKPLPPLALKKQTARSPPEKEQVKDKKKTPKKKETPAVVTPADGLKSPPQSNSSHKNDVLAVLAIIKVNNLDFDAKVENFITTNKKQRIITLNLSNHDVFLLPAEIGNLTALKTLNLSRNNIRKIPPSFGNLKQLRDLNLARNKILSLPEEFYNLTKLKSLDLSRNKIQFISAGIGRLDQLNHLDLSRNKITELPSEIGQLLQLKKFFLNFNSLKSLPSKTALITSLKVLNISMNDIEFIPKEIFVLKPSLHFAKNKLCNVSDDTETWLAAQGGYSEWISTQRCELGAINIEKLSE